MRSSRQLLLCASVLFCALATRALAQDNETESDSAKRIGDEGTTMHGYTFQSDVSEHARLDLDQKEMEKLTDASDWSGANALYSQGSHSTKPSGKRTLQGFSKSADSKMKKEGYFRLYKNYYDNKGDYADRFVQSGLGSSSGKSDEFRAEIANKGSQYQNVWMYIIHEMEDAIDDCDKGDVTDNEDKVKAWDEAWAFYTGSLVEKDAGVSGAMIWTLAQKRCNNFGTCRSNDKLLLAKSNIDVRDLFKQGQGEVLGSQCSQAVTTKNKIVSLMTVPIMQGIIRYVYAVQDAKENEAQLQKSHAEGWAFSTAILPLIDNCDSGVADMLIRNFHPDNEPMKDSASSVVKSLSSVYRCLGFSCEDVGTLTREKDPMPKCESNRGPEFKAVLGTDGPARKNSEDLFSGYKGINPVGSKGKGGLGTGAIVGIVIGVLALAALIGFLFFWRKSKAKKVMPIQAESGSSGGGPGEVFG